ncbi:MAG: hypothetical protein ACYC64_19105 [Armatimonadota bacterium]
MSRRNQRGMPLSRWRFPNRHRTILRDFRIPQLSMLLYIAALTNLPKELVEAAQLDGAWK